MLVAEKIIAGCFHGLLTLYIRIEVWEAIPELAKMKWPKEDEEEVAVDLAKLLVMCDFAKFATELLGRMKGRSGEGEYYYFFFFFFSLP